MRYNPVLLCVAGFAALALASYGFQVYDLVRALLEQGLAYTLVDRDFANYWVAGQMVASGDYLELFSQDTYFPRLQALFGADYQIRNWGYPPHYLLLISPLGLVGYKTGFVSFLGITLVVFIVAALVFRRAYAPRSDLRVLSLALFGFVLMMLVTAQNGFLTAAALLFGLAWMRSRPLAAGLAFAVLTVKPQLGLLVPLLLVFDRNWRTFLSATACTTALVGLSVLSFGIESWLAYLTETLAYQRSVMTDWYGIFLRMMPTVFGSVRTLGFSPETAANAQLPVTIAAAGVVLWLLHREGDPLRRALTLTCGTFLLTPYAFNYDMGALCVCAAVLAGARRPQVDGLYLLPIALVAAIPPAVMNLGRVSLPCTPLVLASALVALVVAQRRLNAPRTREAPAPVPTADERYGARLSTRGRGGVSNLHG
jgi:hypothetical protein